MYYSKSFLVVFSIVASVSLLGCGKSEDPKPVNSSSSAPSTSAVAASGPEQFSNTIAKSDLVGDWSAFGGRGIIEALPDESYKITNENKNVDTGKVVNGVLEAKDWKVTGRLSVDKKSLIWSNGAIWKR